MQGFLRSLLADLQHQAGSLRERVAAQDVRARKELRDYILFAYTYLEDLRNQAQDLRDDPAFGDPAFLSNHLQLYRRLNERYAVVDWYLMPLLERYNERDHRLTQLCRRFAGEANWPLHQPILTTFSNQYFWTNPDLYIISVPGGEGLNFLTFPGICHEMGHILLKQFPLELAGKALVKLAAYRGEGGIWCMEQDQRAEKEGQLRLLYDLWKDAWLAEFACDMIATYLVGQPYGWQHMRLWANSSSAAYHPSLGDTSDHPAYDARMQGILAVLARSGQPAPELEEMWASHLKAAGERVNADYPLCYPQEILATLADNVMDGCARVGLKRFDEHSGNPDSVAGLLETGWNLFLEDPGAYAAWQRKTIRL